MKEQLIHKAIEARQLAYAPYSNFQVGAALLAASGEIYTGCNIENAAYPATCCAERVAIFNALASGEKALLELAVVADSPEPVTPCGTCRQVMGEFFEKKALIHMSNMNHHTMSLKLEELLPYTFNAKQLDKK